MKMKKSIMKYFSFLVIPLVMATGVLYAQRLTGKITGVVYDEEGTPLPGVTVEISSPALMGGVHSQITDEEGRYRFPNLPPGTYKIVFKLQGFQTSERANLIVSVNSTVTQNVTLRLAALEETVTVIAPSPVVDVAQSGISTNYAKDQLERLPFNRRYYYDIVDQTPGITNYTIGEGQRFIAYGSMAEETALYMDGVDMSNPEIGIGWSWPRADVFEEVEITGIGAQAEYGNFSGAVINIITKSGGNRFSGSAAYYGQYNELIGDNNPKPYNEETGEGYHPFNLVRWYDLAFTLGGPILKDKVWFFGAFTLAMNKYSDFGRDPSYPQKNTDNEQLIKISAQIGRAHKLVIGYNRQKLFFGFPVDPYNMPETVCAEELIVRTWNAVWTWVINKNSFFELKYAGYDGPDTYTPWQGGDIHQPSHFDMVTGIFSGGPFWSWFYEVTRHQVNGNFTHFADDFLAGSHEFKFGVQFNRGATDTYGGYGGGKFYLDYAGDPYLLYTQETNRYGGTVVSVGAFIDDSWKLSERLTVNLGLRFDHHNASIPSFPLMSNFEETGKMGKTVDGLFIWNSFSPRIGVAFQLTSDARTLLKASYGRYYIYPYIANWEWPGPNAPDLSTYQWDGEKWVLLYVLPTEAGYTMDPDIKHPYYDQFSLGLERELSGNFSLGASFIYKEAKDVFGYEDRGGVYEQVMRISPDNGQTYQVWNWVGGEFDHWLTNPEAWGQTYKAIILEFNKRFSDNWLLNASITWSKAYGLNLSSGTSSWNSAHSLTWYTGKFGSDPNNLINARGPLNLDRRWLVKISFAYNFPWDIILSANYLFQTGAPALTYVRIPDLNQPYVVSIQAEPKGKEIFASQHLLSLRIEKSFNLYKTGKLSIIGDIFNVLNEDATIFWRSYDAWSESYREPSTIPFPRRFQLGLKIVF